MQLHGRHWCSACDSALFQQQWFWTASSLPHNLALEATVMQDSMRDMQAGGGGSSVAAESMSSLTGVGFVMPSGSYGMDASTIISGGSGVSARVTASRITNHVMPD